MPSDSELIYQLALTDTDPANFYPAPEIRHHPYRRPPPNIKRQHAKAKREFDDVRGEILQKKKRGELPVSPSEEAKIANTFTVPMMVDTEDDVHLQMPVPPPAPSHRAGSHSFFAADPAMDQKAEAPHQKDEAPHPHVRTAKPHHCAFPFTYPICR